MNTKFIQELEINRANFIHEKTFSIQAKCYDRARIMHLKLKKIERQISSEQSRLWNFTLRNRITLNNYNSFLEIYRYFDQLNYKSRINEKIQFQIIQLNEDLDEFYKNDESFAAQSTIDVLKWLRECLMKY